MGISIDLCARLGAKSVGGPLERDGMTSGRTVSQMRENLPIVAEADTDDSCFPSESAFGSLHRFGDLCDRCSSLRVRFEFFHVLFRPGTAMRCLFLRRHEQSP